MQNIPDPPKPDAARGHETTDANVRAIVGSGLVLAAVIVASLATAQFLLGRLNRATSAAGATASSLTGGQQPPEPRLQSQPRVELDRLRRAETEQLQSYRWVDRERGVVQVPIDRAMQLLAEQGFPGPPAMPMPTENKEKTP